MLKNFDRGFIKWQPFNSVISNKTVLKSIAANSKIDKPTLFPEELENIENKIINAYYEKDKLTIYFYLNGKIRYLNTYIKKINRATKTITLEDNHVLLFNQIIKVK